MIPSHRLENNDFNNLSTVGLIDAIDSMSMRAEGIIVMLQNEFTEEREKSFNDNTIFQALSSVKMEILDIRKTVSNFHEEHRNNANTTEGLS